MTFDFLGKFTTHLRNVLVRALTLVHELHEAEIGTEHLLWAIATEKGSIGAEILFKSKLNPEGLRTHLAEHLDTTAPSHTRVPGHTAGNLPPRLSLPVKRTIERAITLAATAGHRYIGTEHLLSALLGIQDHTIAEVCVREHIDQKNLRSQMQIVMRGTSKFPELAEGLDAEPSVLTQTAVKEKNARAKKSPKTPALDYFTIDLTNLDLVKTQDPVVGRSNEIERLIQILARRTKNNPVLLGEPGVGKTAIVEGLARRIAMGEVPELLWGKRILELDLALVVAGTIYRGEFEGRLKQILDEVARHPEIILFIDEIHTLVGAGAASGSMDAANILKPALARGVVRVIGATTPGDFKKYIEGDPALERRLQAIAVAEPSAAETREILEGIRSAYEEFHGVAFSPSALDTAVSLAERYMPERRFPDKAIDILDEAAAAGRLAAASTTKGKKIQDMERALAALLKDKARAIETEDFDRAIEIKNKETQMMRAIADLRSDPERSKHAPRRKLHSQDVTRVVSRMVGVPLEDQTRDEEERLLMLETTLGARIVGQGAAVAAVAAALRRAKTGLHDPKRPLASFLFLGPTGVGKTELAHVLAEIVFQKKDALIRLDMSEFAESFTVSKLVGAPAGYVGYKETTKLTDLVKHHPYAVVLFDEIEKAHPDVLNILLQILEDGHLTDAVGRKINFKNTIIVLTSNQGSNEAIRTPLGFGGGAPDETSARVMSDVRSHFRPELLNRLDEIVVFNQLTRHDLEQIVGLQTEKLNARLAGDPKLTLAKSAKTLLAKKSFDPRSGAREVRRVIQESVERPLAEMKLRRNLKPGDTVSITATKEKIALKKI